MENIDKLWIDASLLIYDEMGVVKILNDYALGVQDGKIALICSMSKINKYQAKKIINAKKALITPSLIDAHTHLIFLNSRSQEANMRLKGATYEEISKMGGGINSSINGVRQSTTKELYEASAKRLEALIKEGVGSVEIKSGYGLNSKSELKMLEVAQMLEKNYPIQIEKTFLAAHAIPKEFKKESKKYIDYVCYEMFEEVAKQNIATAVDVYCENIAFSVQECQRVYEKAKEFGLNIKIHAEQFSNIGATKLASKYGALSADHLEYIDEDSIKAMATANMVAILLPGAFYFLRESKKPPIDLFRKHNVPMAIATDLNPGTSPLCSLLLMLNMSFVLFKLTPTEAFLGVTLHAAKALGLQNRKGRLKVGFDADFCLWNTKHFRDIVCEFRANILKYNVIAGEIVNV